MPDRRSTSALVVSVAGVVLLGVITVMLLPPDYRSVGSAVMSAVVIAGSSALVIAAWEGSASADEIGMWYIGAVVAYTCIPLLAYMALGLQYTPLNDGRLFALQPTPSEIAAVGWMQVAYLAAFCGAYLLLRGHSPRAALPLPVIRRSMIVVVAAGWIATTLLLFMPRLFFDLDATTYLEQYTVIQRLPLGVRQLVKLLGGSRMVLDILLLVVLFRYYDRTRYIIAALVGWLLFSSVVFGGSRTELMITLAVCAALFHRFVRPIRLRAAVAGGLVGVVLFLAIGLVRAIRGVEEGAPFTLVAGAGEFESLLGNAVDLRDRQARGEFPAGQLSLALSDMVGLVPSQLLPFQKQDLAVWYLNTFYPDIAERGGGFAFGVTSQAIVGFGLIDLIIRGLLVGGLYAAAFRLYRRRAADFWFIALNCFLIAWSYQAFRASTFYGVTLLAQMFLPTMILVEIARQIIVGAARKRPREEMERLPAHG